MTEKIIRNKILEIILWVGLVLSGFEWVKLTGIFILLYKLGATDRILDNLPSYYLCMLIVVGCAGFLLIKEKMGGKGK